MKNFDEVRSEVFRRSKERITARKRRKKWAFSTVATAAGIMLFIGVYIWNPWSDITDNSEADNITMDGVEITDTSSMNEFAEENMTQPVYVSVEIVSSFADGTENFFNDEEKIEQIAATLSALYEGDSDDSQMKDFESSAASSATDRTVEYKIILKSSDGSETVYMLIGNALFGENNGSSVTLTNSELQELQKLLGI